MSINFMQACRKDTLDEAMVRAYIRNQEDEDERYDQMTLGV